MTAIPKAVAQLRELAISRLSASVQISVVTRQTHSRVTGKASVMLAIARAGLGALVLMVDAEEFGLEAQLELLGDLGFRPGSTTAMERAQASIGGSSASGAATAPPSA